MKCGHTEPSTQEQAFKAKTSLSFKNEYKLYLNKNDTAIIEINKKSYVF